MLFGPPHHTLGAAVPGDLDPRQLATDTAVIFLVDGSGSVTEEDFSCMTSFIATAGEAFAGPLPLETPDPEGAGQATPACKFGIVQFSNEVRVELELTQVNGEDPGAFFSAVEGLQRMNGGTNIALAVQKAGQMMKDLPAGYRRVIALLTDGRIDSYQAREAHDMAARLVDEQNGVALHAFGVGRGVDRGELLKIIRAGDAANAAERYLPLMVLDDPPW